MSVSTDEAKVAINSVEGAFYVSANGVEGTVKGVGSVSGVDGLVASGTLSALFFREMNYHFLVTWTYLLKGWVA